MEGYFAHLRYRVVGLGPAATWYARLCRVPMGGFTFSEEWMEGWVRKRGKGRGKTRGTVNCGWYVKWKRKLLNNKEDHWVGAYHNSVIVQTSWWAKEVHKPHIGGGIILSQFQETQWTRWHVGGRHGNINLKSQSLGTQRRIRNAKAVWATGYHNSNRTEQTKIQYKSNIVSGK